MKFVAPVVLLLVLSGALYKTKEVFSKDGYDWFVNSQIGAMSKEEDIEPDKKKLPERVCQATLRVAWQTIEDEARIGWTRS